MSLAAAKLIAEIAEIGTRIYGTVVDRELARKNAERDEKLERLEKELEQLKKRESEREAATP